MLTALVFPTAQLNQTSNLVMKSKTLFQCTIVLSAHAILLDRTRLYSVKHLGKQVFLNLVGDYQQLSLTLLYSLWGAIIYSYEHGGVCMRPLSIHKRYGQHNSSWNDPLEVLKRALSSGVFTFCM